MTYTQFVEQYVKQFFTFLFEDEVLSIQIDNTRRRFICTNLDQDIFLNAILKNSISNTTAPFIPEKRIRIRQRNSRYVLEQTFSFNGLSVDAPVFQKAKQICVLHLEVDRQYNSKSSSFIIHSMTDLDNIQVQIQNMSQHDENIDQFVRYIRFFDKKYNNYWRNNYQGHNFDSILNSMAVKHSESLLRTENFHASA